MRPKCWPGSGVTVTTVGYDLVRWAVAVAAAAVAAVAKHDKESTKRPTRTTPPEDETYHVWRRLIGCTGKNHRSVRRVLELAPGLKLDLREAALHQRVCGRGHAEALVTGAAAAGGRVGGRRGRRNIAGGCGGRRGRASNAGNVVVHNAVTPAIDAECGGCGFVDRAIGQGAC